MEEPQTNHPEENPALFSVRYRLLSTSAALLLLGAGSLIYLGCRPEEIWLNRATKSLIPPESWAGFRCWEGFAWFSRWEWGVFSLPNALWSVSWVMMVYSVWEQRHRVGGFGAEPLIWALSIPGMGMVLEIGQYAGLLSGTFDLNDVVALLASVFVAIFFSFHFQQ
jgi:hypothetical protein